MKASARELLARGLFALLLILTGVATGFGQVPAILVPPQSQVVSVGSSATFTVGVSSPVPLTYQWRRDGADLPTATNASLTLNPVAPGLAGLYAVVVRNVFGAVTSAPATLVVIPVLPGTLDPTFDAGTGANGLVRTLAIDENDRELIAGLFTQVNRTNFNSLARLTSDGSLDPAFDAALGFGQPVYAMRLLANGQVLIGGDFNTINGTNRNRIARLHENGALDTSFDPGIGPSSTVWAMVVQTNGKIVVGGDFFTFDGTNHLRIARLNANGSLDTSYVAGLDGSVRALTAQPNGQILVGGSFTAVNGTNRYNIARLNSDGSLDLAFNIGLGPNNWVNAIVLQSDGKMLIGGLFSIVNGAPRGGVARLNSDGSLDATFDPGPGIGQYVTSLALQSDGKVLVGGGFKSFNGHTRNRIARLHPNGQLDLIFDPGAGANDWIESIALQADGRILIGGEFTSFNDMLHGHVARLRGGDPQPFAPVIVEPAVSQTVGEGDDVTFAVRALGFPEPAYQWQRGGIDITGATTDTLTLRNVRLTNAGQYSLRITNAIGATNALARLDVTPALTNPGAPDINFYSGVGPSNRVNAIAIQNDGRVVIGGLFGTVNGVVRNTVARLNGDGSVDPAFDPGASLSGGAVNALAVQTNGQVVMGGSFFSSSGNPHYGLARANPDGTPDLTFNPVLGAFSTVYAMALQPNGHLLIGGNFAFIEGVSRPQIARLNSNGTLDPDFNTGLGPNLAVFALAGQSDGKVLIAGVFTSVNGVPRNRIARLNPDGSLDLAFAPGSGANSDVNALVLQGDGRILIAGTFTTVNGVPCHRVARLNPDGTLDPSFDAGPGADYNVNALALQPDGKVLIGGKFEAMNGQPRSFIARLNSNGSLDPTFDPGSGPDDWVYSVAVQGDGRILIGGDFFNVNEIPRPHFARLLGGTAAPSAPVITHQPDSQSVLAGQDVILAVQAGGVPAPGYRWRFNGTNISAANNWLLRLRNVRTTNAGNYSVVISNAFGTVVSAPALLSVNAPPRNPGAPDIEFYSGAGPNDRVNAVAVQSDHKVLIGGTFTEVDGAMRNRIARLKGAGSLDPTFDPGLGANDRLLAVALQHDGRVLIGGDFTSINGTNRNRIARLNSDGSLDLGFDPGLGAADTVYAVTEQINGQVLLGGSFQSVHGLVRNGLARLNSNGTLDASFAPAFPAGAVIHALTAQNNGQVLVGGAFTAVGGFTRNYIARLNSDGSLDLSFNAGPGPNGPVLALALQDDGSVLIAGGFNFVDFFKRGHFARLGPNGSIDLMFGTGSGANDVAQALLPDSDGKLLLGGSFRFINSFPRSRIARLGDKGLADTSFDPGTGVTDGTTFVDEYGELVDLTSVLSLAPQGAGKALIAGDFTQVNGITRKYVARLFSLEASGAILILPVPGPGGPALALIWDTGVLQQADQLTGPWSDVANVESPHVFPPGTEQKFFRLKFN